MTVSITCPSKYVFINKKVMNNGKSIRKALEKESRVYDIQMALKSYNKNRNFRVGYKVTISLLVNYRTNSDLQ